MPLKSERGTYKKISPARMFMNDLMHYSKQIPTVPVARTMNLATLVRQRTELELRPSWTAIMLKAFALVADRHACLRRSYVSWPTPRLYEHPLSVAGVAIEKQWKDEKVVLATQIRGPEQKPLSALTEVLRRYRDTPVEEIGYFRQALRLGRMPQFLRRFLWWTTLSVSGYKKAKRLGTFGVSSYGKLGAEQVHPIGPLTCTLTFGPISDDGQVVVKIIYDHRTLDGAQVARYLQEMEQQLQTTILRELQQLATGHSKTAA